MNKYKLYLRHGDEAITKRTALRYNVKLSQDFLPIEVEEPPAIFSRSADFHTVEADEIDDSAHVPIFEENDDIDESISYRDWAECIVNNIRKSDFASPLRPKNLNEFLHSETFSQKITTKVDKTGGEIFLMILKFCTSNHLSLTAMTNLFKFVNTIFETPILPDSKYICDKLLNPKVGLEFHAVCNNCSAYVGEFNDIKSTKNCTVCNTDLKLSQSSDSNYFVLIDPSTQISDLLSTYEYHYDYVVKERIPEADCIKDVYDGKAYRHFVESLPVDHKHDYVTAVLNTDGAPIYKSSKYSIWPIFLKINELPKQERMNNLIPVGLWFNKKKPDMPVFLSRFVELINRLTNEGIKCTINGENRLIRLHILTCCADSVARAPIQGIKQFNGSYRCTWCLHPGVYAEGIMKYPYEYPSPSPRCHDDTVKIMIEDTTNTPFGIKYPSPLINLPSFNIISGFVSEYMHAFLEGIGAQFLAYYLQGKNEDEIYVLDQKMKNIAPPQQLQRLCRPLSVRNDWKAREWENFILYYSIPVLKFVVSKAVLNHWKLFVESLYILLQEEISIEALNHADEMLHTFVLQATELHGIVAATYNLHQSLHICESVLNWGPVWTNSTFCFESANYDLLRAIKCAHGVTHQIVRYVNICHSMSIVEEHVGRHASVDVKIYCNEILTAKIKNVLRLDGIVYCGHGEELDDETLVYLQLSDEAKVFKKIIKDKCLYESYLKSKSRTNNSFAQLTDKRIIRIHSFIVDDVNKKELVVGDIVKTKKFDSCKVIQLIDSIDNNRSYISISEMQTICVSMYIDNVMYICPIPNLLHY